MKHVKRCANAVCGRSFVANSHNHLYCGLHCYWDATRERRGAYQSAARATANPEERRAKRRAWAAANRDALNARCRAHYAANREKRLKQLRESRAAHPSRVMAERERYKIKKRAKLEALNRLLGWAKEQGIYNG